MRGIGVGLGQEHDLARGARQLHLVAGFAIAQEVAADALLFGVLGLQLRAPVHSATHAQTGGLTIEFITVAGGGNGVEAHAVGLARLLGILTGRNDTVTLALPIRHVAVMLDDDVAGLACGVGADNALNGLDGADEGRFVLEQMHRGLGLTLQVGG